VHRHEAVPGLRPEEDLQMAGKQGGASRLVSTLAGAAATFAVKKLLTVAWKQVTGKAPPEHPEDPQTALREALIWGILLGAAVHTAKLLAVRATTKKTKESGSTPAA
jgi:hypothetical protein